MRAACRQISVDWYWTPVSGGAFRRRLLQPQRQCSATRIFSKLGFRIRQSRSRNVAYEDDWGERWSAGQGPNGKSNTKTKRNQYAKTSERASAVAHGTMRTTMPPDNTLLSLTRWLKNSDFDLPMLPNRRHGLNMASYMTRRRWDYCSVIFFMPNRHKATNFVLCGNTLLREKKEQNGETVASLWKIHACFNLSIGLPQGFVWVVQSETVSVWHGQVYRFFRPRAGIC